MAKADATRRAESAVVDRLHSVGGATVAKHLGVSEATVTRLKNEHLGNMLDLLDELGFKVVPKEMQCYDPETISALMHFAKKAMSSLQSEHLEQW